MDHSATAILASGLLTGALSWEIDEGGILRLSGRGAMPDWSRNALSDRPWDSVRDRIREVHAENGVTKIGARSFCGCGNLESVFLPETLSTVSYHAFYDCRKLEEVHIPGEVSYRFFYEKTISAQAEPSHTAISRIRSTENTSGGDAPGARSTEDTAGNMSSDLPFGTTAPHTILLGLHAFARTPWGIRTFGEFVFRDDVLIAYMGCEESVTIPSGTRRIHDFAFAGLPVSEVSFPDSVTEIGAFAFNGTRLRLPKLPGRIRRVENGAFSNIAEFEGAVLPRANMTKVFFHPRAFLGSANQPPVLSPGKNRRFTIRQTPLPNKRNHLELELAAKEKYVGVDMVRTDLTMEQLLWKHMALVQILYDPEAKEILQVAGIRGLFYPYRTASTACAMISITPSGEYRLKTCDDLLVHTLFGRHNPEPILSRRRSLATHYPFAFTPCRNRREAWIACPRKDLSMDSESFLADLKRGLFAWQDMHPEYRLSQDRESDKDEVSDEVSDAM